jgi:predicted HicB family RNase H-like nuclease
MKRVIEGKTYNTDTAIKVALYQYEDHDGYDTEATIYLTRGGAFFAVHTWDVKVHDGFGGLETKNKVYVEALSREEVDKLVETENMEIVNEKALTLPPEAVSEAEAAATIYVRVPEALKARVDEAAEKANASINAWALRCFEACLARVD